MKGVTKYSVAEEMRKLKYARYVNDIFLGNGEINFY